MNAVSEEDFSSGSFSPETLRYVFPQAHIEILRAIERLELCASRQEYRPDNYNVIARVERDIFREIINSVNDYSAIEGREALEAYEEWNQGIICYTDALEIAVRMNFNEESCGEMGDVLKIAFTKLLNSDDPAVKYRMNTYRYLKIGSQVPFDNIDLEQCLHQFNNATNFIEIRSPSGEHIGFLERHFDGSWSGDATISARLRFVAWERNDAAWLLLRLAAWPCEFLINGVTRRLILIGQGHGVIDFRASWGNEPDDYSTKQDFKLKFWDNTHGLNVGDKVAVNVIESPEWRESQGWGQEYATGNILLGDVSETNGHEVTIIAEGPVLTTLTLDEFMSKYAVPDFFE